METSLGQSWEVVIRYTAIHYDSGSEEIFIEAAVIAHRMVRVCPNAGKRIGLATRCILNPIPEDYTPMNN